MAENDRIDCGIHYVYLEVDEHQHGSYTCECEQTRMVNLVEVRGMSVTFIRYNSDTYEPIKGQRMMHQEQREKKLLEYALKHSPRESGAFSNILYVYYDECDTANPYWHELI